jgi:hypothetical protein
MVNSSTDRCSPLTVLQLLDQDDDCSSNELKQKRILRVQRRSTTARAVNHTTTQHRSRDRSCTRKYCCFWTTLFIAATTLTRQQQHHAVEAFAVVTAPPSVVGNVLSRAVPHVGYKHQQQRNTFHRLHTAPRQLLPFHQAQQQQREKAEDTNDNKVLLLEDSSKLTNVADYLFLDHDDGASFPHNNINKRCTTATIATTRRLLFGSALMGLGTALGVVGVGSRSRTIPAELSWVANAAVVSTPDTAAATAASGSTIASSDRTSRLQWQVTPVNKRTGVTVFDAERAGYKVNFVTYLSRFLLTFDPDCQRWWYNRASDIPRTATEAQVTAYRNAQFGAFSASVEVGLQEYRGPDGPQKLLNSLVKRYCPDPETVQAEREAKGLPPLEPAARARQERECKEARRQICLLFGLMEQNQPVQALTQQLAAIDNGSIARIAIEDRGSGYAPGYGSPEVRFPPPEAGAGYVTATGRAVLSPNGKLLRIDVVNRGLGYQKPPEVFVSPPAAIRFGDSTSGFAEAAEAQAFIFRSGPNKGRIERVQLISPGAGYTSREIIRIRVSPPDLPIQQGGVTATATAVLEYEVSDIQIVNNGTGYAVEKPIRVYVEPPPLTARVNMNDPMMARIIAPDEPLPATSIPSPELRKKMPNPNDPNSVTFRANYEAGKGGGGGCIGRACYDRPVVAVAYPTAENKNIFNTFRKSEDDSLKARATVLEGTDLVAATLPPQRIVSAASAGELPEPINFVSGGPSELLSLLPAGVGLEFNALYNRYELAVDPYYQDATPLWMKNSARKIDPDFGPRGRSPIERDMQLGLSSYLRFILSGAICCSGVHLALTPIDGTFVMCHACHYLYNSN